MIRLAISDDARALLALIADCVAHMRARGIEQWDEVYPNADNVTGDIGARTLHVLCADDEIIGCVTIDDQADPLWQGLAWSDAGEPFIAVHRLMIHPSWQGRGLSKLMMAHVESVARAKGCRSVRLDTFTQNPVALGLYETLAYRRTGMATMRKGLFIGLEKML
jgi:GNAT superfamily N-acetyltransferase